MPWKTSAGLSIYYSFNRQAVENSTSGITKFISSQQSVYVQLEILAVYSKNQTFEYLR
jgi:hypothetical protein